MESDEFPGSLVHRPASDITMRVPKWLWNIRVPLGQMTLLASRGGIGKSSVALMIAAKLTRGTLEGQFFGKPRGVAIVAAEDDWASTIVPRLVAAGADLSRVHQIEARREEGRLETISVPHDVDDLSRLTEKLEIALLIVDPVMSVLPGNIDTHKDREVRKVLEPMVKGFAQKSGVSVLGLIHVNKSSGTDPLNTIMASRAFTALSRSVLFCQADPDDEDVYLLGHVKSNLGPKAETVSYRLVEAKVEVKDAETGEVVNVPMARAVLGEIDDRTIADILQERQASRPVGALSQQLLDYINEQPGAVPLAQIQKQFSEHDDRKIRTYLSRLANGGRIDRPAAGIYQAVVHRPKQQPSATPSNTIIRVISVASDAEGATDATHATGQHVRRPVAQHEAEDIADAPWPDIPPPDWD
jgi:hypothetical protein